MENTEELKQAEAHLKRAEAALETAEYDPCAAPEAEHEALRDIGEAVEEIREAERHHEIHFSVDGEEFETTKKELTPNQIIEDFGQKDPATHYLVEIKGTHKISFKGKGDEEIKLHDCMAFQIVSTGPTPVSHSNGPGGFMEGLRMLGYEPQHLPRQGRSRVLRLSSRCRPLQRPKGSPGTDHPQRLPEHPSERAACVAAYPADPHPERYSASARRRASVRRNSKKARAANGSIGPARVRDWGQRKRTVAAYMAHVWRLWETQ